MGKRQELLKQAREHIFSLAPRDLAAALAFENMSLGLGKMFHVLDGKTFCVFGPDGTITRNTDRWQSGFGYGGVIKWEGDDVAFPEIRPNGCGMILVKLHEMPDEKELFERVSSLNNSSLTLNGTLIKPDFGKGNHFFEFYTPTEVSPDMESQLPRDATYSILHCSSPERKPLIYDAFQDEGWTSTPLGMFHMLEGKTARDYLRIWQEFESFCKKRRALLMKEVTGRFKIISNETHQGLFGANEIRLGCYRASDNTLFPVALRWDLPVYIMQGIQNLSRDLLKKLRFQKRAERLGLVDDLIDINILPHGGGYKLLIPYTDLKVHRLNRVQYFSLKEPEQAGGKISRYGRIVFRSPRELPYDYRGKKVIRKTIEYKLGEPVAKLQPVMTLKV